MIDGEPDYVEVMVLSNCNYLDDTDEGIVSSRDNHKNRTQSFKEPSSNFK